MKKRWSPLNDDSFGLPSDYDEMKMVFQKLYEAQNKTIFDLQMKLQRYEELYGQLPESEWADLEELE